MKYQKGKIKKEHNILKDFDKFISKLEKIEDIDRIIPGRISRQQKASSDKNITISYSTISGLKMLTKKGGTVQEIFVIIKREKIEYVRNVIENLIKEVDL